MDAHGKEEAQNLLPLFEEYLAKPTPENENLGDRMRQGAVVFLGTAASHMESGDLKVFHPFRPNLSCQSRAILSNRSILTSWKAGHNTVYRIHDILAV